jgi:hypothetical protein
MICRWCWACSVRHQDMSSWKQDELLLHHPGLINMHIVIKNIAIHNYGKSTELFGTTLLVFGKSVIQQPSGENSSRLGHLVQPVQFIYPCQDHSTFLKNNAHPFMFNESSPNSKPFVLMQCIDHWDLSPCARMWTLLYDRMPGLQARIN